MDNRHQETLARIGLNILYYRKQKGYTQQQLAERVHVSARTVISIEKEQYSPSLMLAYRMAEVFGVTVEELCCLRENREWEDRKYEDLP